MRKRIDAQPAKVETEVNPFVTAYQKLAKRLSYNRDRDTDLSVLDYQDALQDTIIDVLEKNPFADSPVAFLKHATKMAVLRVDRYAKVEFFGDDIDPVEVALPDGSIVDLRNALQATLDGQEYTIFMAYSQGYTLAEIATMQGIKHDMQVKRILYRASRKVESLGIAYWTEAKVECYQGKAGRPNCYFAPATGISGEVVNRQFLCLDQNKVKKQLLPDNYSGDMIVNRKEAIVQIADALDKNKYSVVIMDSQYMSSTLPAYEYNPIEPYANNKEAMQLYTNRKQYVEMVRSNSIVVKENRYNIEFAEGRYISTDHKFKNLPD